MFDPLKAPNPWPVGRYRALAKTYRPREIGGAAQPLEPGEVFVMQERPARWMEPLDAGATAAFEMWMRSPDFDRNKLAMTQAPDESYRGGSAPAQVDALIDNPVALDKLIQALAARGLTIGPAGGAGSAPVVPASAPPAPAAPVTLDPADPLLIPDAVPPPPVPVAEGAPPPPPPAPSRTGKR